MDMNTYQARSAETDIYPPNIPEMDGDDMRVWLVEYRTLCLCGEAGELANKVKKIRRDGDGVVDDAVREQMSHELGDMMWYMARLCEIIGVNMGDIAVENLAMLKKRMDEGKICGAGDKR